MPKGLFGTKVGMTQIFDEEGQAIPVTVVQVEPCRVVQKKTTATDGYEAVQVGIGTAKPQRVNKPLKGHFAKANVEPARYLREIRIEDSEVMQSLEVGQELRADLFQEGEYVDVTGTSKGKGFAGAIKRWNFHRGPMSHGSMYHRRVGSLGATDPQRVFKGRKLPGRMGGVRRTVQGLQIVKVDPERNLLLIRGSVPGPKGALLEIRETVKAKYKG
ncbi:MAG TPA: 50S ribosomal protein L3 [Limnochordia bacterium]|nr:50S ribosomal protein L3 [Limnochordia bacterium]